VGIGVKIVSIGGVGVESMLSILQCRFKFFLSHIYSSFPNPLFLLRYFYSFTLPRLVVLLCFSFRTAYRVFGFNYRATIDQFDRISYEIAPKLSSNSGRF